MKAQQQLTAGHILRERFVLKEHLGSTPGYELRERDEGPGVPGSQFPDTGKMVKYAAYGTSHLGTGSFGDTWKAYDINLRKYVAVKIFYTRGGGMPAAGFLTPHTVRVMGAKVKSMVQEAVEECTAVKTMVRGEHGIGPQRLCQCFEDHVNDASEHEPIFLVLELCGKSLTEKLRSRTATWAWRKPLVHWA
ncbi:unnamed protein product [Effrenium voratum]|uniref:Protein kinase domain-containing protein n=1 Tax=Effrenium voratum TaxID=2562239 RepID=A0AA36MUS6_9DINO|nr:unnamed protein product [Effrenium voratum]